MSVHDYTIRSWGHDFSITRVIDEGRELRLCGWGSGIREGDYLILPNGDKTTRYEVSEIRYESDPHDQWFATALFAPRAVAA